MEAFAFYLFRSVIWLTGFAMVFLLFLRNERFFLLKRFYLVSGILISLFFPLISVHYQVELPAPDINTVDFTPAGNYASVAVPQVSPDKPVDYRYLLLYLYLTGVLFFAFRLIWHLRSIYRTINKTNISNRGPAKLIRASEFSSSFSFFNYVFINPSVSETEMEEIMNHELVHVRQKHWFDLLLVELLRMMQWANPFMWIYTGFIRLNHEYLADEAALQQTSDPAVYKAVLLNQLFSSPVITLSNSFNYLLNKNRFDMMKKTIASPYRKLKVLFVLPVIATFLYAFATPEYHYIAAADNTMTLFQDPANAAKEVMGIVVNEEGNPVKGATVIIAGNPAEISTDAFGRFTIGNVTEEAHLIISSRGCVSQYLEPVFSSEMTVKMRLDKENPLSLLARASYKNGPHPLILLNGEESNKRIDEINENEIISMGFLLGKFATLKYGDKGKAGVIIIETKKKSVESGEHIPDETIFTAQKEPSDSSTMVAKVVKGTVVKEYGKPLQGVIIAVSGESKGTISDADGHFAIGNIPENSSLVFSYGGYLTQILKAVFTSEMTVKLIKYPEYIAQEKVRSLSTLSSDGKPLIIIDGVESQTGIDMITPNEISSISVLRNASSTAAFGAKGTYGVIIVTSKKKAAASAENKPDEANAATQKNPYDFSSMVAKEVKGIVVEQDGKPLWGASIVVKGTTKGCKSDAKGYFLLNNLSDEDLLVVSYVGFISKVVKPDFSAEMILEMKRYTVNTELVNINPPPPDRNFKIKSANGIPPLIVVDGSIRDIEVNKIDPNTIESVRVLKDKYAIDKYGERGKDGVVEVTTKKINLQGDAEKMPELEVTGYANKQKTDEDKMVLIEEMPAFPGGNNWMSVWISATMKYPKGAIKDKITGLVYVNFVVSRTGKVRNVQVRKPVHPLLDAEAIRVISNMPDWKPGKQDGKPVDVDYMVPVDFKLK